MNIRDIHKDISALSISTYKEGVLINVDDDDCAVVSIDTTTIVVTTDFINNSPAIVELGSGSWYNLGQLVVCHNLADLAGSGCKPQFFLSGLCVPSGTNRDNIMDFVRGVCDTCIKYDCALIGGDTKFGLVSAIYGTAIGTPMGVCGPFLRTKAKPGYKILASGFMGRFASAVACIGNSADLFSGSELAKAQEILFDTNIPFALAEQIASCGFPCAGTDISDGLGTDLLDICKSSSVGAAIVESAIPLDDFTRMVASRFDVPAWSFAFACGGDFSCVFGVPDEISEFCAKAGATVIGDFEEGTPLLRLRSQQSSFNADGHSATRTMTFADEIINNVNRIKADYDSSAG